LREDEIRIAAGTLRAQPGQRLVLLTGIGQRGLPAAERGRVGVLRELRRAPALSQSLRCGCDSPRLPQTGRQN